MISKFFIDRPIFASVLSIVIVLAGLLAMRALPVAQYPEIVPPQVVVSATYPGRQRPDHRRDRGGPPGAADQRRRGHDLHAVDLDRLRDAEPVGLLPDRHRCRPGDINVNNRVQRATAVLPEEVRRQGVTVAKRSTSILQVVALSSPDRRYDTIYISNYALVNVIDELRRVPGVGDASLFGASDYSMRIWLKPDKVAQYDLTPGDIAAAIREQNAQFAAGRFAEEPMPGEQAFTYSATTQGRLADPREFEQIILRSDENGAALRLKDVARVELGSLNYSTVATLNGAPTVPIGIYLQPDANALDVAGGRQRHDGAARAALPGRDPLRRAVHTTRFIEVSIEAVVTTFIEAIVLVVVVVFVFLQNWRATFIPSWPCRSRSSAPSPACTCSASRSTCSRCSA